MVICLLVYGLIHWFVDWLILFTIVSTINFALFEQPSETTFRNTFRTAFENKTTEKNAAAAPRTRKRRRATCCAAAASRACEWGSSNSWHDIRCERCILKHNFVYINTWPLACAPKQWKVLQHSKQKNNVWKIQKCPNTIFDVFPQNGKKELVVNKQCKSICATSENVFSYVFVWLIVYWFMDLFIDLLVGWFYLQ